MSDRILGYLIILILAVTLLLPLVLFVKQKPAPVQIRTIEFSDVKTVSFLFKQDPVRINGAQVGTVLEMRPYADKAIVKIELQTPVTLNNDYIITAYLKGLMGERYVSIIPGKNSTVHVPPDVILHGKFISGPSEIIAYMDSIKTVLKNLNGIVLGFKDGSRDKESLVNKFNQIYMKADTLTVSLNTLANNMNRTITRNRDTLQSLLSLAIKTTDSLSTNLPEFLNDFNRTLLTTNKFITQIDTFISKTDSTVSKIGNVDAFIWKDDLKKLQIDLASVRVILNNLREDGLILPVRLRLRHN
jgi:phospholipid/cholesterol/gamma-HCH transport system substrate-binding protein